MRRISRICSNEYMVGGEAGSTSQHFSHPAVEPVSPSHLPGWPGLTLRILGIQICRDACTVMPMCGHGELSVASVSLVPALPRRPFGVAWLSDRLYRVTADFGPAGKAVEVDGWEHALDDAWRQLLAHSDAPEWVASYVNCRGDEGLTVVFGDTTRVIGRRGYGNFNVSYPVDLLLGGDDHVSAMRTAILAVLDRHVDKRNLDVPLLSGLVHDTA